MAIPYLPHMCEDALKEKRGKLRLQGYQKSDSTSSFDQEAKEKMSEMSEGGSFERRRSRDSVGRCVTVFSVNPNVHMHVQCSSSYTHAHAHMHTHTHTHTHTLLTVV